MSFGDVVFGEGGGWAEGVVVVVVGMREAG